MVIVHVVSGICIGGVAEVVKNLLIEQERKGYKTVVVTRKHEVEDAKEWIKKYKLNIRFYSIERYRQKRLTVFGGLSKRTYKQIVKDYEEEQIVFHFHNPISVGLFSYLKVPFICTMHTCLNYKNVITCFLFKTAMRRVMLYNGVFVGCSKYISDYYTKMFKKSYFETVTNGVLDKEIIHSKYVKNNGMFHIGFAAHICELKGWRVLAEAYEMLPDECKMQCDVYYAGRIDDKDKDDFMRMVESESNVFYVGNILDAQSVFLPYLDVLVLPSKTEGMPMVVLEAFQMGLPVIVTPVGGIPELVKDNYSGFFIQRDANDLAEKIKMMLKDDKKRDMFRKNARKTYEQEGNAKKMQEGYMELYRRVLKL